METVRFIGSSMTFGFFSSRERQMIFFQANSSNDIPVQMVLVFGIHHPSSSQCK